MFSRHARHHPIRVDRKRKRCKKEKADCILYSRGPKSEKEAILRRDRTPNCTLQSNWKVHQNAVHWVNLRMAQQKGLTFYQTLSNAIILHDSVPADYIEKVVNMNSTEVLYESAYVSPRPAPKIVLKESWQSRCEDDPQTEERGRENRTSSAGRPAAKTRLIRTPKWITVFKDYFTRTRKRRSKRTNQQTGSPDQESSKQGCATGRYATRSSLQSFQREVKGNDPQYGQRGIFRDVRNFSFC